MYEVDIKTHKENYIRTKPYYNTLHNNL